MLACCTTNRSRQFLLSSIRPASRRRRQARVHARVSTVDRKLTVHGPVSPSEGHAEFHKLVDVKYYDHIRSLEASYQHQPVERVQQHANDASLIPSAGPGHAYARQLRRARRATRSATETHGAARLAPLEVFGLGASDSQSLVTILDLLHLLQQEPQADARPQDPYDSWWQTRPPRLLTAAEEQVLGSVVQQNRKLQQLYTEYPDIAASLPPLPTSMQAVYASSTSSRGTDAGSSSCSRSRNSRATWPPKLTQNDVEEVRSLSVAWRALLPELAAQAQHLLVAYNTKLLTHMRRYARAADHVSLHDHVHAGLIGLKIAAERYDPSRNTRFSTVASSWILAAMNRAASKQAFAIRQPVKHLCIFRHVLDKYGQQVVADIEQHPKVVQQVSEQYNTSPRTICRIVKSVYNCQGMGSLDNPSYQGTPNLKGQDNPLPWSAMVTADDLDEADTDDADSSSSGLATEASYHAAAGQIPAWLTQQQQVPLSDDQLRIKSWLPLLTPQEQQIVLIGCGLDDHISPLANNSSSNGKKKRGRRPARAPVTEAAMLQLHNGLDKVSFSSIGRQVGLTSERVRQVWASALLKLQKAAGVSSNGISSTSSSDSKGENVQTAAAEGVGDDVCLEAKDLPHAVADAIASCTPNCRKLLRVIYTFYNKQGRMPTGSDCMCSKQVGKYCDQIVERSAKGRLQAELAAVFEAIAPGWLDSRLAAYQQQVKDLPQAVADAIASCTPNCRKLLRVIYTFYNKQGRMPTGSDCMCSKQVGKYCDQIVERSAKGRLQAKLAAVFEAIAPGWLDSKSAAYQKQCAKRLASGEARVTNKQYYAALLQFVKAKNCLPEAGEKYKRIEVGRWVQQQRSQKQSMSAERQQLLEAVPGWEWVEKQQCTDVLY